MASMAGGGGGGGGGGIECGSDFRLPCSVCCRKFSPDVLTKHEIICQKTAQKKRKTFDSAKQRILGTDIPTVSKATTTTIQLQQNNASRQNINHQKKKPLKNRLDLSKTKEVRGNLTSFQNRLNAGLVQCPTCERNFSDKAADRHIPWCKDLKARIPRSPPCNVAKDRLTARIQYRAPLPGKRRYSPPRHKTWSPPPPPLLPQNVKTTSPSSAVKVTGTAIHAQKRGTAASNLGSVSNLSNGGSNGMIHSTSWEFVAPKNNYNKSGVQPTLAPAPSNKNELKTKSKTDLTSNGDGYDPFESAQRQMEELMSGASSVSPVLAPKLIQPGSRTSTNQVRENKIRSNQSSYSVESDKELEDIEEDLVFDEDVAVALQFLPPPHPHQTKGSGSTRHPRRTVSREEALFGSKHSTGSLDSDYGSLMRRSPSTPVRLVEIVDRNNLCSSRSSSETSLPPLGDGAMVKMSRFCHECGSPYPISNAKFCCDCGIRRLCIA